MSRRLGIELSSSRCAVLDLDLPRGRRRASPRIRSFRTIPWSSENTAALVTTLKLLRRSRAVPRRAVVALWGLRSGHQVLSLPPASPADLCALALREARSRTPLLKDADACSAVFVEDANAWTSGMTRGTAVIAAAGADVRTRLAPLVAAGFTIDAVITPPMALLSLAGLLHPDARQTVRAYVAVNMDATAVAVVRNGLPLLTREIPLAFADAAGEEDFVARLVAELKRSFLFCKQQSKTDVEQVCVCGEFPNLRALTAPLMRGLHAEVAILDTLRGPQATASGAALERTEAAGDLHVAWSAAAAAVAGNLLPAQMQRERTTTRAYSRLAAGVAASVLLIALLYGMSARWTSEAAREAGALRQRLATLDPVLQRLNRLQQEAPRHAARLAALAALESQGPRLARLLEVLARSTPPPVVLSSVDLVLEGATWKTTLRGSIQGDPAPAQAAFNQFLHGVSTSPYLGRLAQPPQIHVSPAPATSPVTSASAPAAAGADQSRDRQWSSSAATSVPAWPQRRWDPNEDALRRRVTTPETAAQVNLLLSPARTWVESVQGQSSPAAAAAIPPEKATSRLEFVLVFEVPK